MKQTEVNEEEDERRSGDVLLEIEHMATGWPICSGMKNPDDRNPQGMLVSCVHVSESG